MQELLALRYSVDTLRAQIAALKQPKSDAVKVETPNEKAEKATYLQKIQAAADQERRNALQHHIANARLNQKLAGGLVEDKSHVTPMQEPAKWLSGADLVLAAEKKRFEDAIKAATQSGGTVTIHSGARPATPINACWAEAQGKLS